MARFNFFQRIRAVFNQSKFDELVRDWMSGKDVSYSLDGAVNENLALKFSAVFACLRVLAETFCSCPIFEYKKINENEREKTDETGLYDILHTIANVEMDAFTFWQMVINQLNANGNAVSLIQKNQYGMITGLTPFEYDRVDIRRDENGRLQYKIDGKTENTYPKSEMFHVLGPSMDGIIGLSPLQCASQSIRLGLTYEQFGVNFFKNGIFPTGVFEHPTHLGEDEYKRLKHDVHERYTSLSQKGTPIITESGMKFNQLQLKLVDAELLSSKKFQIEDICRIYRVPLHLVQNLDKATFGNIEHQSLDFTIFTMLPIFRRVESAINSQLLTRKQRSNGLYYEFNMAGLLRGDMKSMYEAFNIGRNAGFLSVNDIRRLLNMNPVDGGDSYLQPLNMGLLGQQPEPKEEPKQNKEIAQEIENLIGEGRL